MCIVASGRTGRCEAGGKHKSYWLLGSVALGALIAQERATAQDVVPAPLPEIRVIAPSPIPATTQTTRTPAPVRVRPVQPVRPGTAPAAAPAAPAPVAAPTISDPTVIDRDKVPSSVSTVTPNDINPRPYRDLCGCGPHNLIFGAGVTEYRT